MPSRTLTWILLFGVCALGTGASVDGVREAREWQHAADMARAQHQPLIAHSLYLKVAETFPETQHGRYARNQFLHTHARLVKPVRPPASDNPLIWLEELLDFLTWP